MLEEISARLAEEKWEKRKFVQAFSREEAKRHSAERQLQELLEMQNDLAARLAEEKRENHRFDQALSKEEAKRNSAERHLQELLAVRKHLTARLAEQKRISRVGHGAVWQYEEGGCWHALPPEGNDEMQEAYLNCLRKPTCGFSITINSAGVSRRVDFGLMQQKRCDTNKIGRI
ncbi:unnamed protein product [Durusdinium trenchii]|uniref:WWE domain-containing protein n=1 Tax=Durusdinium trenchii TaxID=1381693 RepID=A0ABP0JWN6_9DINO